MYIVCQFYDVKMMIMRKIGLKVDKILLQKETLAQVFSCEFCEIFEKTYFYRTSLVAASE